MRAQRRAIALDPKLASAWINLGNALAEQGRYEPAEAALRQAQTLDPSDPRPRASLGDLAELRARQPQPGAAPRGSQATCPSAGSQATCQASAPIKNDSAGARPSSRTSGDIKRGASEARQELGEVAGTGAPVELGEQNLLHGQPNRRARPR